MRGIRQYGIPACASIVAYNAKQDYGRTATNTSTIITIEANESTPLLVDHGRRGERNSYNTNSNSNEKCDNYTEPNNEASNGSNQNRNQNRNRNCSLFNCIQQKAQFCELRLVAFILVIFAGLIIATYLLIVESRAPSLGFALDLVNHDIWSKIAAPLGGLLNHTNVLNIVMTHTGGNSCHNTDSCLYRMRQMQIEDDNRTIELPYNFLIGGDETYEVRGWDFTTGFESIPQATSLVIGFIGNYTHTVPNNVQMQSAVSLIKESVRRKKLQQHYRIYGIRNITASHMDGAALFEQLKIKWPRFDSIMHF